MKKLLLTIILLISGAMSFAQEDYIIYTDYGEGLSVHFDRFNAAVDSILIDLDHDNVAEFGFYSRFSVHNSIIVLLEATDQVTGGWYTDEYYNWRLLYNVGDSLHTGDPIVIGDTLSLQYWGPDYATPYHMYDLPILDFPPPGSGYFAPHFIGIRHRVEDDFYYGWLLASVYIQDVPEPGQPAYNTGEYADVTVYGVAFCTIPNYPLCVGQTSMNWETEENNKQPFASIFPNPTDDEVIVVGKDLKLVEVHNALGQLVASVIGNDNQLQVDLTRHPAGLYFINITNKNGQRCVKKVMKTK